MVFGWMSGATVGGYGIIDVGRLCRSGRLGRGMFIRSAPDAADRFGDWIALPENDHADGPIACIADDDHGLDMSRGSTTSCSSVRARSPDCVTCAASADFTWTDWSCSSR